MQWFRFHTETLNNPKAQKLPGDLFKIWVNILCIAAEHEGVLPPMEDLAFKLRASLHEALHAVTTLIGANLITVTKNQYGETYAPKNWNERQYKSDTSNERVKRHREKNKTVTQTVTVTAPEQSRTETEQNRDRAEQKDTTKLSLDSLDFVFEKTKTENKENEIKVKKAGRLQAYLDQNSEMVVSQEWGTWSLSVGMNEIEINEQMHIFCDYWKSAAGQKGVKQDWTATWRNWCRKAIKDKQTKELRDGLFQSRFKPYQK